MARERDRGDSFDPRTWGGVGGAARPVPPGKAAPIKVDRPTSQRAAPAPSMAARTAGNAPLAAALAVSALLLAGGVVLARLRPSTPPTHRLAGPEGGSTLAILAAAAGPAQRTLTVGSPADIATSLAQEGVIPEVAQGAGQEAASVLGPKLGEIRLMVGLAGPDGARELSRLEATRGDGSGVVLTARPDGSYISEPKQPTRR